MKSIRPYALLCSFALAWAPLAPASATAPVSYIELGSIGSPGSATQLLYSNSYQMLVLRNGGSAVRVLNLSDGTTQTFFSSSLFTDMSLSPSGRYVYVADYGYENIGYGTPRTPSHVGRLDLASGTWESKDAAGAVAYHVEAVDDDHFILTSLDQWITFTYDSWGSGTSISVLNPMSTFSPGYYAGVYQGDIEYDSVSGRLIHGNSGLSSQEIAAFKLSGNTFTPQEESGTYGSAQGYGGTVVLAADGSAFYYGRLQVDSADVKHNRLIFGEPIYAANARAALGNGKYYDAATGTLLGSLGFATTAYGMNRSGDDFWAYDASSDRLRHFFASDGPLPSGPQANTDLVRTGPGASPAIDVLSNDLGFGDPATVTIATAPAHGTAAVTGSPGPKSGIRIQYSPAAGFVGSDSLVYTVDDGTHTGSATVAILVDAFRARPDTFYVGRNSGSAALYVARNDVGFTNPVTLTITSSATQGSVYAGSSPGNAQSVFISYYAYSSSSGPDFTDSFSYQISDGVHSDSATVTVNVVSLKAVDDSATTGVAAPVTINVIANDVASYGTTVGLFETPRHGIVSPGYSYGTLVYTPEPGFAGADSFVYALDDGQHVDFGTVTVLVIHDQDGDGVSDEVDNCTLVPNPDQRDTDGDGYGNVCDADLNEDGMVNFQDLAVFRQKFASGDPDADFDGNGIVNFADLARLRVLFLKPPGPSGLHR
jgi:hypothetical protein